MFSFPHVIHPLLNNAFFFKENGSKFIASASSSLVLCVTFEKVEKFLLISTEPLYFFY